MKMAGLFCLRGQQKGGPAIKRHSHKGLMVLTLAKSDELLHEAKQACCRSTSECML